jgi:hypothetical protein
MIEFIKQEKEEETENCLTILDVEDNQFFINGHGHLCQKIEDYSYNVIADEDGNPFALHTQFMYEEEAITKILDPISKIKFQ